MKEITVVKFLEKNKDFLFPNNKYSEREIENALLTVSQEFEETILNFHFRDPSTVQIISLLPLGFDRFYLGQIGLGLLKYCTFGVVGILWIKDMVSAKNNCRAYNCKKLMEAIENPLKTENINVNANSNNAPTLTDAERKAKNKEKILKGIKIFGAVAKGFDDISNSFDID